MMKSIGTKGRIRAAAAVAGMAAVVAAGAFGILSGPPGGPVAAGPAARADQLTRIEADVDRDYPGVRHMTTAQLAALKAARKPVLLFDVREAGEYKVSRIAGAQQVDPGVWTSSFLRANRGRVKGRTVVFYCSVGVRSSKLARRVQKQLMADGAAGVFNLRGGVFRWHNDARPLMDAKTKTPFVHPYDKYWGRLVNRQKLTRYRPTAR